MMACKILIVLLCTLTLTLGFNLRKSLVYEKISADNEPQDPVANEPCSESQDATLINSAIASASIKVAYDECWMCLQGRWVDFCDSGNHPYRRIKEQDIK